MKTISTMVLAFGVAGLVVGLGCRESDAASKPGNRETVSRPPTDVAGSLTAHIDGNNFKIDTEAADCKVGADCTAKVKLTAAGEYHINKEYPYKLTMAADKNVEFAGKNEKDREIFSRSNGDFEAKEKEATMNVRFKAKAAGALVLKGTYKMSVCSEQNCQLETKEITIEVKAK